MSVTPFTHKSQSHNAAFPLPKQAIAGRPQVPLLHRPELGPELGPGGFRERARERARPRGSTPCRRERSAFHSISHLFIRLSSPTDTISWGIRPGRRKGRGKEEEEKKKEKLVPVWLSPNVSPCYIYTLPCFFAYWPSSSPRAHSGLFSPTRHSSS